MNPAIQIAKHFRDVYFGGNWTSVNLKQTLSGITWEQAITKVCSFNTIAILVYHMNYYVSVVQSFIEQLPESRLWEDFTDKKYGNYYRNLHGIIEHTHYHLGQIVLIKKTLLQEK